MGPKEFANTVAEALKGEDEVPFVPPVWTNPQYEKLKQGLVDYEEVTLRFEKPKPPYEGRHAATFTVLASTSWGFETVVNMSSWPKDEASNDYVHTVNPRTIFLGAALDALKKAFASMPESFKGNSDKPTRP